MLYRAHVDLQIQRIAGMSPHHIMRSQHFVGQSMPSGLIVMGSMQRILKLYGLIEPIQRDRVPLSAKLLQPIKHLLNRVVQVPGEAEDVGEPQPIGTLRLARLILEQSAQISGNLNRPFALHVKPWHREFFDGQYFGPGARSRL